jgi:hypothetical protein
MKHKHADLIHAWADGAEIQFWSENFHEWCDVIEGTQPDWYPSTQYRIKPEEKKPVVRWLWVDNEGYISNWMYSEEEAVKYCKDHIKLEWSRTEFPE